ncbi:MAG: transcriptional regulator [Thalassospira sp. Nap_22]|nr:MAG: transcriptional regulator [Thalassospira sp. Nap_22]
MEQINNQTARGGNRGRTATGAPNPIDVHVGSRVRLRRTLLGMSQEKLGDALGLTFQQIQKYERGANRVGASRLYDISRALEVPVSFFFDDMPAEIVGNKPTSAEAAAVDNIDLTSRANLELIRNLERLPHVIAKDLREMIGRLARGVEEMTSTVKVGDAA